MRSVHLINRAERAPQAADLWVIGKEVGRIDVPPPSAHLRWSSPEDLSGVHSKAVSADMLLTPNAEAGPVVTHEPGSDLRFLS
jgi:hypothetical protein